MRLRHQPGRRPEAGRSEAGETLIEVLATVLLMGTGIIAILGALLTSVTVARQSQEKTTAGVAVQKVGEEIAAGFTSSQTNVAGDISGSLNYIPCATAASYNPLHLPTDPTGGPAAQNFSRYTAEVTDVDYLQYYDGNGTPIFSENPDYSGNTNCFNGNARADKVVSGLQRVTVEIKHDGKLVDRVIVYKRNEVCPDNFSNADQGPC